MSNAQAPRVLIQWEHMLAVPRPVERSLTDRVLRRQPDPYDVDRMYPHPHVTKVAWDYCSRVGWRVDAWTQWPVELMADIRRWIKDYNAPCYSVVNYSMEELEAALIVMPFVRTVIHCGDGHPLAFGGKGQYVAEPGHLTNV